MNFHKLKKVSEGAYFQVGLLQLGVDISRLKNSCHLKKINSVLCFFVVCICPKRVAISYVSAQPHWKVTMFVV